MALVVKNPPATAGDIRDVGLTPEWGRSPGGGNGNPLQRSCLESPMDRGAWRTIVHGVAENLTRLTLLCIHACMIFLAAASDLRSLTGDPACSLCSDSAVLITGPPGNFSGFFKDGHVGFFLVFDFVTKILGNALTFIYLPHLLRGMGPQKRSSRVKEFWALEC